MSTRIHALGFQRAWDRAAVSMVLRLATKSRKHISCKFGDYSIWRSLAGAELWFHFPRRRGPDKTFRRADLENPDDMAAITPFHAGLSSVDIIVERRLGFDRRNMLHGSYLASFPDPDPERRRQQLIVEMVPFALQPIDTVPSPARAQIVCFAHAMWAFSGREDYLRATPTHRRLSLGSFSSVTEDEVPEVPLDYAESVVSLGLVTGTIRRSIRHLNPLTSDPYYWLQLETKRGAFDVRVNPGVVEGDISEGCVAQVCGSFIGRVVQS